MSYQNICKKCSKEYGYALDFVCYDCIIKDSNAKISYLQAALDEAEEALEIYSDFEKDQKPNWYIAREALAKIRERVEA